MSKPPYSPIFATTFVLILMAVLSYQVIVSWGNDWKTYLALWAVIGCVVTGFVLAILKVGGDSDE